MRKSTQALTQSGLLINAIPPRPRPIFIRIQQLIAIATLGVLFWLWFGVSTHGTPRPGYPYYDTQKPVPPWSEPAPLQGNYGRAKEITNEHSK